MLGCGKDDHKVSDCPTIAIRGREVKKAPVNSPDVGAPKMNRFYHLLVKQIWMRIPVNYSLCWEFSKWGSMVTI